MVLTNILFKIMFLLNLFRLCTTIWSPSASVPKFITAPFFPLLAKEADRGVGCLQAYSTVIATVDNFKSNLHKFLFSHEENFTHYYPSFPSAIYAVAQPHNPVPLFHSVALVIAGPLKPLYLNRVQHHHHHAK